MRFTFSRCIAVQTPEQDKAVRFYSETLGLPLVTEGEMPEITAGQNRLFIDEGPPLGPVMELEVENLDAAKEYLIAHGCEIVRWGGPGKANYVRDPFGLLFNLWLVTSEPNAA